jgi:hypothetical protein
MSVIVSSGGAVVLASGTVIAFQNSPVTIEFGSPQERMQIRFEFVSAEGGKMAIQWIPDGQMLRVELTNFTDSVGAGPTEALHVGADKSGAQLFVNFRVSKLPKGDPTLTYSVYAHRADGAVLEALARGREMQRIIMEPK